MKRRLSSISTWFWKVVFPAAWILGFCTGTGRSIIQAGLTPITAVLAVVSVAGSVYLWMFASSLSFVSIDECYLYVSNLRKEIQIPVSAIQSLKENFHSSPKCVTILLKAPTEFGNKIAFVPQRKLLDVFKSHPVVAELREVIRGGANAGDESHNA